MPRKKTSRSIKRKSPDKIKKKNDSDKKKKEALLNGSTSKTKIRIIGIGGGGNSIISEISSDLARVDFIAANTDKRSLGDLSGKVKTFQFGEKITGGFGTGMDPEIGKVAAGEEKERIKKLFEDQDVCILVASLGAGTGSGATPIFAKAAKESGCITYGIFTLPFDFEGSRKMEIAREALEETKPHLNAISIFPNENIFKIIDKDAPLKEALSIINSNLSDSLKGLIEAIYNPGLINIDFADFKTILEGKGKLAYLNVAVFDASKEIDEAVKKTILNPFYSYGIKGASGILLNVTGSKKIGLKDVSRVSKEISDSAKKNATIILGIAHDEKYGDNVKIMVLAVGCEPEDNSSEKKKRIVAEENKKPKPKPKNKKSLKSVKDLPEKKKERKEEKKVSSDLSEKVEVRTRRNALEIRKATEDIEKELLEEEKKWETPAFLRRGIK